MGIRDTTWRREAVPGDPVHRMKSGHSRGAGEMERVGESTGTAGEVRKRPVWHTGLRRIWNRFRQRMSYGETGEQIIAYGVTGVWRMKCEL